jgi:carbon monoxide dehydrogenase subunit G
MIIEETFTIDAPLQRVWDFFFDIDRMSSCVPGAEATQIDENNYEGRIKVKVGPIGISMGGTIAITQKEAPTHIEASLKAKDKMTASLAQGTFTSRLREVSPNQTEVSYSVDVVIRGKLGQMAQGVVSSTAKRISGEFRACVQEALT